MLWYFGVLLFAIKCNHNTHRKQTNKQTNKFNRYDNIDMYRILLILQKHAVKKRIKSIMLVYAGSKINSIL